MASKALFAALDLDLFTLIEKQAATIDELAGVVGIPVKRLQFLMTPLRALGIIGVSEQGRYINSPAAARYLSKSSRNYYGDYFRFQIDRQLYPAWLNLIPAMHGHSSPPFYDQFSNPEEARHFSVAQHTGSLGPAHLLAQRLGSIGWRRMLDVAGGTGAFSITLCLRNPALTATILDFPSVCEVAAGYIAKAGLTDRIALLAGDARVTSWPTGQDAVLMSYLISAVRESEILPLMHRAFESLAPGGALLLHDFMVTDDRAGPPSAALWLLLSVIGDPDALQITPGMLMQAALATGFVETQEFELLPGITRTVIAKKPSA